MSARALRDLRYGPQALNDFAEAAAALNVHRHTVVYRVARLRDLGVGVDDPAQSHAIWLALRCVRLLSA